MPQDPRNLDDVEPGTDTLDHDVPQPGAATPTREHPLTGGAPPNPLARGVNAGGIGRTGAVPSNFARPGTTRPEDDKLP